MKRITKILFLLLVLLFIILFLNRNNYYDSTTILTNDSIKKFEKDLKEGKEINPNNYIVEKKTYQNKTTLLFSKISKSIELVVNKSLNRFIKYIDNWHN